jgi:transposase, IS6 family
MNSQNQNPFKWRHFQSDIILLCVRWYLRYSLSYRDLEEMMLERGLHVDHTTIFRSRPALCSRTGEALPSSPQSQQ